MLRIMTAIRCFNPRTRVGCDAALACFGFIDGVSIHAPVWGATLVVVSVKPWGCFNPRTRVGCDRDYW